MTFPSLSIGSSISLVICVVAAYFKSAAAFGFSYIQPKQCNNFTVTWNGGSPPFELLITPRLGIPQFFSLPNSTFDPSTNTGSFSTTLNISSQTIFLMTMSDSTGFGSGGTTVELTVGDGDSSCTTDNRPADFSFRSNATVQQCRSFVVSNYGGAVQPLTIYGLIPQGNAFVLHPPSNSSSYTWNVEIAAQTHVMFTLVDSERRLGGSTDIIPVGSSSDASCLNSSSPGSSAGGSPTSKPTGTSVPTGTSSSTPTHVGGGGGSSNGAAIGGGVGGGVAALLLSLGLVFFIVRRRKNQASGKGDVESSSGAKKKAGGRRMHNVNLLPERSDRMAQYPLNANPLEPNDGGSPGDYEPVPYVLPPPVTGTFEGLMENSGFDRDNDSMLDAGGSTSAMSKAAMANQDRSSTAVSPNGPARFVVHTDAGSVLDDDGEGEEEEDTVELPPQYTSLGVLIPPQRQPSRRRSQRHSGPPPEATTSGTSPTEPGPSSSHST